MYIDVDENITEMQDRPSLEMYGPPRIANFFFTLWPIYEKLVVNFFTCCNSESLVTMEST